MAGFADLIDDMDAAIMATLSDGEAEYLSVGGSVLVPAAPVMLDKEVERLDEVSGALSRAATITARKALLQPFDRKGAFRLAGKTWHIDGIAADDGHLITFFVVP